MLKVCDIVQLYSHEKSGGIKRYLREKIAFLAKRKDMEHLVILPGEGDTLSYFGNSKCYFVSSPKLPRSKNYRFVLNSIKIWQILKNERPDIVELSSPFLMTCLPSLCSGISRQVRGDSFLSFKTIGFYHTHFPIYLKTYLPLNGLNLEKWATKYLKNIYNKLDCTVVTSHMMKNSLEKAGIEKLIHIPLGVDTSVFYPFCENRDLLLKLGIDPKKVILCYIGRFYKEKGLDLLFEVFKALPSHKFHMLIAGDGSLRPPNLKNLTYLGYIEEKKRLAEIYATSDYFVTPSLYESFGLSVLEAQACGTPVIAFKGAISEEIFGEKDYLLPKRDLKTLLECLARLEKKKEKEKRKLSDFIRKHFSWERTFRELTRLYVSLFQS